MEIKTLICGIFLLLFLSGTANLAYAITETDAENAVKWFNEGNVLNELGKYEEAIEAFNKAIKINSNFSIVWYNKGNSLRDLGRDEEAIIA